jgi:uncharacterized iron-regulated protein
MRRLSLAMSLAALMAWAASMHDGRAAAVLPVLPDLTSFLMLRSENGQPPAAITIEQAADALKKYDVILFGEWHDHAGNHLAEMQLFRALYAQVPLLVLSMEQFERDVQGVVDDYMAGRIGEDALRGRGRAWPNYAEAYRPLVEYAKERHLPVLAANAPASVVRCVGQEGPDYLARLASDKRGWAAKDLHLEAGVYRDKFFKFLDEDGSHGADEKAVDASGQPTASALRGFAAQVTRDDTMAESIALYLQKNPGHKVVHLTGAFHVASFLGTAERLRARAPNLKIAVINPVQVDDPEHPALGVEDQGGGNFSLLLMATPKDYASEAEERAAIERIRASMRNVAARTNCSS